MPRKQITTAPTISREDAISYMKEKNIPVTDEQVLTVMRFLQTKANKHDAIMVDREISGPSARHRLHREKG